jgi:hypothetical protein
MESNIFQEYKQRLLAPWCVAFVLYLLFIIVVFGGSGVLYAMWSHVEKPTNIGYIASNLSTYSIALLVPAVITIMLSFHKTKNKVSSAIILVVILILNGFLLHFSNAHQQYSIWTAIITVLFAWFFWIIANYDNEYLNDASFEKIIKKGVDNHNKDGEWNNAQ